MKNALKRALCSLLSLCFALGGLPAALAEEKNKEEVIYTVLNSSGEVDGVYAVNIFPAGEVVDYGDYSSVKMLNTEDDIRYEDGEVSFASDAERVYYQGDLKEAVMPWRFTVRYFLDGQEMTAGEIAGQTGHVEIKIGIARNPEDTSTFFESHALQVTAKLDTDKCKNITTDGATEANVG